VIRQDDERDSIPLLLERTSGGEGPRGVEGPLAEETAREARVGAPSDRPPDEPPAPPPGAVRAAVPAIASTRLGAAGLLIAALLVLLAVFAELLASDLPIACHYGGRVYLLPNVTRPAELTAVPAEEIASFAAWSVYPLVRHDPRAAPPEPVRPLLSPGKAREHPLGTDLAGRDVFARMVHGTRSYLVFALLAVMASLAFGALFGGLAGILGGGTDALVGRAIETVSAFPPLVLVIGIQAAVPRPTLTTLFFAIALTRWPQTARLVRGEVMLAATRDYVLAARALGASPLRVLRRHITPNIRGPLIVASAIGVSAVVLTEASLDYLRIGPADGAASWGETMSQFRDAPSAWWLLAFPGALLFATVIGLNLLGEALRGALDPRSR
jgi:ABC-type dipeptide/oligopeptide/nickel transport system permease subunit